MDSQSSRFEFKAGLMKRNPDTNQVVPDNRQGVVVVQRFQSSGKYSVVAHWETEQGGQSDGKQYLVRYNDASESNKYSLKPTKRQRVYKLVASGENSIFLWSQDPSMDDTKEQKLLTMTNNLLDSHGQEVQKTVKATQQKPNTAVQAQIIQQQAEKQSAQQPQQQPITLQDVLKPENLACIIQDEACVKELKSHMPSTSLLPGQEESGPDYQSQLYDLVKSPQFSEQVRYLSSLIQSGQLDVSSMLGLQGLESWNVEHMLSGIQSSADKQKQQDSNAVTINRQQASQNAQPAQQKDIVQAGQHDQKVQIQQQNQQLNQNSNEQDQQSNDQSDKQHNGNFVKDDNEGNM